MEKFDINGTSSHVYIDVTSIKSVESYSQNDRATIKLSDGLQYVVKGAIEDIVKQIEARKEVVVRQAASIAADYSK